MSSAARQDRTGFIGHCVRIVQRGVDFHPVVAFLYAVYRSVDDNNRFSGRNRSKAIFRAESDNEARAIMQISAFRSGRHTPNSVEKKTPSNLETRIFVTLRIRRVCRGSAVPTGTAHAGTVATKSRSKCSSSSRLRAGFSYSGPDSGAPA